MSFEEYLEQKKIDRVAFKKGEPGRFAEWQYEFEQLNVASFTSQKLYLINPVRRKYPLQSSGISETPKPVQKPRPVFKKPKTN